MSQTINDRLNGDENLRKQVIRIMALKALEQATASPQSTTSRLSNDNVPTITLTISFKWTEYPFLVEVLETNAREFYERSEKSQTKETQQFNAKLVSTIRDKASSEGVSFDQYFTNKKLRNKIRTFYGTLLQNAKKRLVTLLKEEQRNHDTLEDLVKQAAEIEERKAEREEQNRRAILLREEREAKRQAEREEQNRRAILLREEREAREAESHKQMSLLLLLHQLENAERKAEREEHESLVRFLRRLEREERKAEREHESLVSFLRVLERAERNKTFNLPTDKKINRIDIAVDVAEANNILNLHQTGFFGDVSRTFWQCHQALYVLKFKLDVEKLPEPATSKVDLESLNENVQVNAFADKLQRLNREGRAMIEERDGDLSTYASLMLADSLPTVFLNNLSRAVSDLAVFRGDSENDVEQAFRNKKNSTCRALAEGTKTFDSRLDDSEYRLMAADVMIKHGIDITSLEEHSAKYGIQELLKSIVSYGLWWDAFSSKALRGFPAECHFGILKRLLLGLGIKARMMSFEKWIALWFEMKFQVTLSLHRNRRAVNMFVEELVVGERYPASKFTVQYRGEHITESFPPCIYLGGGNFLFDGTEKNLLCEFVKQFYEHRVFGGAFNSEPTTAYTSWWNAMSGNVDLFWGYPWEWEWDCSDGKRIVLQKGGDLEAVEMVCENDISVKAVQNALRNIGMTMTATTVCEPTQAITMAVQDSSQTPHVGTATAGNDARATCTAVGSSPGYMVTPCDQAADFAASRKRATNSESTEGSIPTNEAPRKKRVRLTIYEPPDVRVPIVEMDFEPILVSESIPALDRAVKDSEDMVLDFDFEPIVDESSPALGEAPYDDIDMFVEFGNMWRPTSL